jgi:hypothetical protein
MVAYGRVRGYLKGMKIGQWAYTRSHADLLGQRGSFANKGVRARELIGRMKGDESSVLTNPSFFNTELIGHDDFVEIFVITGFGNLILSLSVGKKSDPHFTSCDKDLGWLAPMKAHWLAKEI